MGAVRPDALGDHYAPLQPVEDLCVKDHLAACIADFHAVAVGQSERCRIVRMDQQLRPAFLLLRDRRLGEGRIQEIARWRRCEPERMLFVRHLDQVDMVGKLRQPAVGTERHAHYLRRPVRREAPCPFRPEPEFSVGMAEALQEMRGLEIGLEIDPALRLERLEAQAAFRQHQVDMLALAHAESRHIRHTQPLSQFLDHVMVGARAGRRLDHLRPQRDVLVAAALVDVVVLQEHRRRQHDVGEPGRIGHELLVDAGEQVVAKETLLHQPLLGRDIGGVCVLDQQRRHRRAAEQRILMPHQHRADARVVEIADRRITQAAALQRPGIELENAGIGVERTAALILPAAGDSRDRERRVHIDRTVSLARETVAKPEEGFLRGADQPREGFDLRNGKAGDGGRPFRRLFAQMRFQPFRVVRVSFQVGPIRQSVAEQDVHDRTGQRPVGAGLQHQPHVGLLDRGVLVDVDHHDLRATFLAGADGVGHHVDLCDDGVGAPDDHAVRLRHLARVGAAQRAGAHHIAGPRQIGADGAEEAGIFLGVAQPLDAVALHQAHRAGIKVWPDRLRPVFRLGRIEFLGHKVERGLPACLFPDALAFGSGAHQRLQEPVWMMDAVGVAGDLGADDAGRIGIVLCPVHAADAVRPEQFDVERAGGRTVMRAGRMADADTGFGGLDRRMLVHAVILYPCSSQGCSASGTSAMTRPERSGQVESLLDGGRRRACE